MSVGDGDGGLVGDGGMVGDDVAAGNVGVGGEAVSAGVAVAGTDLIGCPDAGLGVGGGTGATDVGLPSFMVHWRSMRARSPKLSAPRRLVLNRILAPMAFSTRMYRVSLADHDRD